MKNPLKKIANLFSREEKSYDLDDIINGSSIFTGLSSGMPIQVTPRLAYNLNERNNDLGNATNRISTNISGLRKGIRDSVGGEIDFNHEIMDILNNPGGGMSGRQFWREASESYLLTQECWMVARGNLNRPPLELVFIRAYDINVTMDESTGYPKTITTTSNKDRRTYERIEENGRARYVDKTKLNELIPIIGAVSISDEWRGRSPLGKLYYDLLMNTDGKRHNTSLLKNGMRTTGILSPKPTANSTPSWSKETVESLQDNLRAFNQGAGNAGNVFIMSAPGEIQGISQTNKDMDYMSLLKTSQESIYNLYAIPLALVFSDAMTYDNLATSNRTYYTKAVFPVYDQMADSILNKLAPRYNLKGNEVLSYSVVDIEDLQPVLVENMKKLKEAEANTINEIRSVGGFEEDPSGNEILVSSNKIPLSAVSSALSFEDVDVTESESDTEQEEE